MRRWKVFWAIVGPIMTAANIAYAFLPSISIELGTNLNSEKPFQTLFVITNTGRAPAWWLAFQCSPAAAGMTISTIIGRIQPLGTLGANEQVTRTCIVETTDFHEPATLTMTVYYTVPIIGWPRTSTKRFDVEKGANGYFLTPESGPGRQLGSLTLGGR